jgi:peptidoglycan hydrolase-like protein with peptidoglycan-binding domain
VLWIAVASAVLSIGGLIASTQIKSPAEQLAEAAPPQPNVLTAAVQHEVLSTTVVLRGTFSPAGQITVTPTTVASTPGNPGNGALVVTRLPVGQGQQITPGEVIAEYSGRPIFTLPGSIPAYRDMTVGETGSDIAQLQKALNRLGYSDTDHSGTFGTSTRQAVMSFYEHIGYSVPTSASGTVVPMSEIDFVPQYPAYVESLSTQVGQKVTGPIMTLSVGGLVLTGQLDPSEAGLVKPGMPVQMLSEATGQSATGHVAQVGSTVDSQNSSSTDSSDTDQSGQGQSQAQDQDGSGAPYTAVLVTPGKPWDQSLDGQNVRLTITSASTLGPVLAVPEAAISTNAAARTTVTVATGTSEKVVEVRTGVSADGLVAVTPVGTTLQQGDEVVVGQ